MLSELFSIFSKLFTAIKNQFTKFFLKPAAKKSKVIPDRATPSANIDWSVKNVMVGTVRTAEQLQFSLDRCGYYVPAEHIADGGDDAHAVLADDGDNSSHKYSLLLNSVKFEAHRESARRPA